MDHSPKRELPDELAEVRDTLVRCLEVLDRYDEHDAALHVCAGYERLIGAPSTMEQWYIMTGRGPDGEDIEDGNTH
ncbi:hypothetical protein SAMN05518849_13418 [Sphingobium sp. AP50]|nr:hypothetical protein SAMN05518849_13418 [Sphingobium sp. AP50]